MANGLIFCLALPMYKFEKLDVWQKAIEFADLVYTATDRFPPDERFGLTSQMRRAVVSVSSNIAEGCTRNSGADFTRFIEIATGSLFETVSQLFIAQRRGYLAEGVFEELYAAAEKQGKMLSGLRSTLRAA